MEELIRIGRERLTLGLGWVRTAEEESALYRAAAGLPEEQHITVVGHASSPIGSITLKGPVHGDGSFNTSEGVDTTLRLIADLKLHFGKASSAP